MKEPFICLLFFFSIVVSAQQKRTDSIPKSYKKRVLETTEVDFLMSYYTQEGSNSAVGGGLGNEELTDITPTFVVSVPLNDDDVLTVDAGISAYTSASSSNTNPFEPSGASTGPGATGPTGSPWVASSGASASDVWTNISVDYSHSSDDRNNVWNAHGSFAIEYDYYSIGFGGGFTKLFNDKNTSINASAQIYLDTWKPIYPTELEEFATYGSNFQNQGYFDGVPVWDQAGNASTGYNPFKFNEFDNEKRNTYSASLSFTQILSKNFQISLFGDLVYQKGLLSTPYQRVYFADVDNYYVGAVSSIPNYTSESNTDVFHLADDAEQLPDSRWKIPLGFRANYYVNEWMSLRSYYRFYTDTWGVLAHTTSVEVPLKLAAGKFTFTPTYRYYTQDQAAYFEPYDQHLSTLEFYTSDYDLSSFNSHQYGLGFRYTDIFTKFNIFKFGLKNFDVRYAYYDRSDGLSSHIITTVFKFVMD